MFVQCLIPEPEDIAKVAKPYSFHLVLVYLVCMENSQGLGIKGRAMTLVRHEKASRTALQTSSLLHTHTLLVQTHTMTTVKEIAEQCRQL